MNLPQSLTRVKGEYKPTSKRLLDQVREVMRYHHYAIRAEQAYVSWIAQFIRFNGTRYPKEMGKAEIERFLSHLAINRNVAASTRNQVLAFDLLLIRNSKCVR